MKEWQGLKPVAIDLGPVGAVDVGGGKGGGLAALHRVTGASASRADEGPPEIGCLALRLSRVAVGGVNSAF